MLTIINTTIAGPEERPRLDVVAAILWQGERFLAALRPEGKPLAGYWEFPGGKVEPGEDIEQALVRELREELGLTPLAWRFWREERHDYEHLSVRLHFFHITATDTAPTAMEGHILRWMLPSEAISFPFLEADIKIVARLAREGRPR